MDNANVRLSSRVSSEKEKSQNFCSYAKKMFRDHFASFSFLVCSLMMEKLSLSRLIVLGNTKIL